MFSTSSCYRIKKLMLQNLLASEFSLDANGSLITCMLLASCLIPSAKSHLISSSLNIHLSATKSLVMLLQTELTCNHHRSIMWLDYLFMSVWRPLTDHWFLVSYSNFAWEKKVYTIPHQVGTSSSTNHHRFFWTCASVINRLISFPSLLRHYNVAEAKWSAWILQS